MNEIENQIQILIDGELSDKERSELLNTIDREKPSYWRNIALGYIESQLIRESIAELAEDRIHSPLPSRNLAKPLLAIAATLIVGIFLGVSISPTQVSQQEIASTSLDSAKEPKLAAITHLSTSGATAPKIDIPVIEASQSPYEFEQALMTASEPIRRAQHFHNSRGAHSVQSTALIQTNLDDGSSLVIPVNYLVSKQ